METIENSYAMPRIGDIAPDFEAVTTIGKIKFSDYEPGKWKFYFLILLILRPCALPK